MLPSACCHLLTIPTATQHLCPAPPQSRTQTFFLWQFFFLTLLQLRIHHAVFSSLFFFSHKIRSQTHSIQTLKCFFIDIVHFMSSHYLIYLNSFLLCFPGGLEGKTSACNEGDLGSTPKSGRSPGEGNGTPLQYSCLENPMDGGTWEAAVHGVTKSQTRLSDFRFSL